MRISQRMGHHAPPGGKTAPDKGADKQDKAASPKGTPISLAAARAEAARKLPIDRSKYQTIRNIAELKAWLGLMGLPQRLAPGVKKIIMRESTGNANAVNDWDSNAASGTPSKGLMQLIDTTFRNAVLPELADRGIFDPVANITAGVRTMIANHSIDDVLAGGLRNSSGNYIGYGGAAIPDDGLGLAD